MGRRILVADDSATIQKVIKIALGRFHAEISEAASFIEALALAGRIKPELIIVDASLPGSHGPDDIIKVSQEGGGAPVILLIGSYDAVDEGAFKAAGISHILRKPFGSGDIITVTTSLLGPDLGQSPEPGLGLANPDATLARGADRTRHQTVIGTGTAIPGGFIPELKSTPAPVFQGDADDEVAGGPPPVPPPPSDLARRGQKAFGGDSVSARSSGGPGRQVSSAFGESDDTEMAPVPGASGIAGGVTLGLDDEETAPRPAAGRTAEPRPEPRPLPPVPGARPARTPPPPAPGSTPVHGASGIGRSAGEPPAALADPRAHPEFEKLVQAAVEDYCSRHFKTLAREAITAELRRLADEKARHLVDN